MRHRNPARRGVLLLVILGLLAMFAMVAVAFVVLTNFERQRGERDRRVDEAADPPDRQLDQAMRVVVRGSINPGSAIHSQSLLEKIYGHETLGPLQIDQPTPVAGGQLLEFTAPPAQQPIYPDAVHRIGAVLTMITGRAAGLSTRIVGVNPGNPNKMQIMAFEGGANFTPGAGDQYVINGVPYSGMGFGYNPSTGNLDAIDSALSVGTPYLALLPFDQNNWGPTSGNSFGDPNPAHWNPPGGANCDYTAPDCQDPLLAFQIPYTGGIRTPLPSLHRPELMAYWAQKAGVSNPQNLGSWGAANAPLLRAIMARPNQIDHPNFSGSNPSPLGFNPIWDGKSAGPGGQQYSWDVDNAGSGVADSVWVDLGFPVRYTAEGKAYKPLVAILCLDLDGRLNVNAHGMLAQAQAGLYSGNYQQLTAVNPSGNNPLGSAEIPLGTSGAAVLAPSAGSTAPSATATAILPRGQGYGPPEVNLLPLFADPASQAVTANSFQLYQNLLIGSAGLGVVGLNGRYGELGGTPLPGMANVLWPDTFNKWWDYKGSDPAGKLSYWAYRNDASDQNYWTDAYLSPPDPQGYGAVGLDAAGRPLWMSMGTTCINTPYDLNLSRNAPHAVDTAPADDPFGPAELEAVLRPFDRDAATLPKRLASLTSPDGNPANSLLAQRRYAVTTESNSVPTPGLAMPPALRAAMKNANPPMDRPRHIVDLLKAAGATTTASWATLLPVEMLSGLKLNLNRPLSNWRAGTSAAFQLYSKPGNAPDWSDSGSGFTLSPLGAGLQSDPTLANPAWAEPVLARQLQARYLFVLAVLLGQQNGSLQAFTENGQNGTTALNAAQQQQLTLRRIAQWAINVVTFSTPESVMVPFKYPLPQSGPAMPSFSNGWPLKDNLIDTDPNSPNKTQDSAGSFGVVWGAKPPELLLTETLAFHDRRVADTGWNDSSDSNQKQKKRLDWLTDQNGKPYLTIADQTLDQPRIPQGSSFIEVFCPRNPRLGMAPADLYAPVNDPLASGAKAWCLDLGQLATAPPGQPGNVQKKSQDGCVYPVWRIVITESSLKTSNPNDDVGTPGTGWLYRHPDSSSLEPEQIHNVSNKQQQAFKLPPATVGGSFPASGAFSLLPGSTDPNVTIERIVWFAPLSPIQGNNTALDGDRVYYNRSVQSGNAMPLPGGQYAVVGPRAVTAIGTIGTPAANDGPPLGTPSPQQIVLNGNPWQQQIASAPAVSAVPTSGQGYPDGNTIKQPVGIVVAGGGPGTNWPSTGTGATPTPWSNQQKTCPNGIGLSISEPLFSSGYYPEPSDKTGTADANGKWEWYGDPSMAQADQAAGGGLFHDYPLESIQTPDLGDANHANYPIVKDNIVATGTTPYYKTAFLQRLANPSAAYDPVNNPYRTVDWMPIDLTVFNGEDRKTQAQWATDCSTPQPPPSGGNPVTPVDPQTKLAPLDPTKYPWDPDDPLNYGDATNANFSSRQRGTATNTNDPHYFGNAAWNLWAQVSDPPLKSVKSTATPPGGQAIRFPFDVQHTLGYINSAFWSPPPQPSNGQIIIFPLPAQPGWITQNNPTPSIPAYIGDPLLPWPWLTWNGRPYINEMELLLVPASSAARLPWELGFVYQSPGPSPYPDPNPMAGQGGLVAYPHLVDFFQSEALQTPAGTAAMELHRLLEFVGVPSRFPCAQTQIPPSSAAAAGAHWFHPPFNRVSNYRDPGKINLNTIPSPEVLQGLLNYFPGMTFSSGTANTSAAQSLWSSFVWSRRGYKQASGPPGSDNNDPWGVAEMNSSYPTRFFNPFRSPSSAAMLPTSLLPGTQREVDATLLRSSPENPQRPLFEADDPLMQAAYGQNWQVQPYSDYNRNAFFRYQELTRLANCVTTRSNVFAVWITVGYFEVSPVNPDAGHPDGWTLGQELGSDTGKIERHRAFYIFDRSIPVGFIRGRDVNQDKALLLRRFIE